MIEELQNLATRHRRLKLNLNPQKMVSILAPMKSRSVGFGCVSEMDGDFKIRANVYALSEAEAIK